jgi:7-cyano-7-deazaguanine reductase
MNKLNKNLNALGSKSNIPESPDPKVLEKITNPKIDINYSIRFTFHELKCICPVTSQHDFYYIIIYYPLIKII